MEVGRFYYSLVEIVLSCPWGVIRETIYFCLDRRELTYTKYDEWGNIEKQVGYTLNDEEVDNVKTLLDVSKYEEFREDENGMMLHDDSSDDLLGYMDDGAHLTFTGISDSPYPLIRINMDMFYKPERIYHVLRDYLYFLLKDSLKEDSEITKKKIRHRKLRALKRDTYLASRGRFAFANNYTNKSNIFKKR
ncbi:hypothetical protein [Anaerovibrio lipolyticus]|uniref:hypothetical protein n=1 Tax=Anaerovibrio lipolyticus TaxID=82374 RepID=UPI0026EF7120|nr:hypothetical protein [Anaerovibrio lipolyticus]MBE6106022.1 hypothetical protein [Anaerovibrio lipolyticus]